MSKTSKAQVKAVERYNKANTVTICIRLNKETDKDILDTLERVVSKQGYIKALIRSDNEETTPDEEPRPERELT